MVSYRWLVVPVLICMSGCQGNPTFAPVRGRITWNGEPLANASVQFLPMALPDSMEAPGPGSTGITDEHGNYELTVVTGNAKGAFVGQHRVAIYTAFSSNKRSDAGGGVEKLPAKYNAATELIYTVKPGDNVANWELTGN